MLQVACISAGDSQEVFSFSFGGSTDNLLAAGCKSQVQCLYYEINHVEQWSNVSIFRFRSLFASFGVPFRIEGDIFLHIYRLYIKEWVVFVK
jgi:hypothetical protein